MQSRMGGSQRKLALLLAIASAISAASSLSFGRTIQEVGQQVDHQQDNSEDQLTGDSAVLYDSDIAENDLETVDEPAKPQKNNRVRNYVTIKNSPKARVNVLRGHRVELTCEVDGSPPPRVFWIRGGHTKNDLAKLRQESFGVVDYTAISREISKYVVPCAGPQDQTIVHCAGIAGDKIVISPPTLLRVIEGNMSHSHSNCRSEFSQVPTITRHRPTIISEIGSSVVLPCEAQGTPKPRIYWTDSAGNRLSESRFTVQEDGSLVIGEIRWSDMDNYKCFAESELGVAEAVTFLYPAAKEPTELRNRVDAL